MLVLQDGVESTCDDADLHTLEKRLRSFTGAQEPELCSASVAVPDRPIRFEIYASGYRRFSLNAERAAKGKNGELFVDVGFVTLVPVTTPKIVNIAKARGTGEGSTFRVTVDNATRQRSLVRRVTVYARRSYFGGLHCAQPTPRRFIVGDRLRVSGGRIVNGIAEELKDDQRYIIDASGELITDECGGYQQIMLSIPTSFELPNGEYTFIDVSWPASLNMDADTQVDQRPRSRVQSGGNRDDRIIDFRNEKEWRYRFHLAVSGAEDDAEVVSIFPTR